ncbi:hypothetical protein [Mesorhizobium sp. AR02]|uniref:hypothetical protein n=1 Tax=Mesorhizobium sp. AR02 TaxID=2865837 RepID=UPI00215F701F|nr:hypothetical protein [Mesorhizobium sp. AR02]
MALHHDVNETSTDIIPAFDYFVFTDAGGLCIKEQTNCEINDCSVVVNEPEAKNIVSFQP